MSDVRWGSHAQTPQQMVSEFHIDFELPTYSSPRIPENKRIALRRDLIDEEVEEVVEILEFMRRNHDLSIDSQEMALSRLAGELADLVYVTVGTALEFGIDLQRVLEAVHAANMSKLDVDGRPIRRDDGKILKGPNYRPADVQGVLFS